MELKIKEIAKDRGLSIGDLAERLGMTRQSLHTATTGNPTLSTLERIAGAIGCNVVDFFPSGGSGQSELTAMIEHRGEMYKFTSVEELKRFAENL